MAPPQFAFQDQADRGAKVAQKKDAGVVQKQEAAGQCVAPATPVIETTNEAWSHYMNGCGSSVDIGPIAIQTLLDTEAFQAKPDGMGPNLERFGGTPYRYNTATRSFTFQNPGY